MAAIQLKDLKKRYGAQQVVHGVSVDIADGEFIVIVGPSGCGKSTLLRMIAGLEAITEGELRIADRRVNEVEPKDRDIAMVFQNYALYPHMSVEENMAYGLKIRGLPTAEIAERVARAATILELAPLLKRRPRELSGGQRQRVAMGRAIVRNPAVFLFDEPLSNLDAKLRAQMRLELQKLHRELKTTSVFVTHDQVEAMTLADRMIVMNAGRVEQIGAPLQVYDQPASLFVASFIGSPAMVTLPLAALAIDWVAPPKLANLPVAGITVGLRPEHLLPSAIDHAGHCYLLHGPVEMVESLGAESLVHFRLASAGLVVARVPTHRGGRDYTLGDSARFMIDRSQLHYFDSATGKRLP